MFIENIGDNNTVFGGTTPQRILSCLNSLDTFLQQPEAVVCSYVTAEKSSAGTAKSAKDLVSAVCNILGMIITLGPALKMLWFAVYRPTHRSPPTRPNKFWGHFL